MTKEQKTIKAQAVQITELTDKVSELKSSLESARECRDRCHSELADIHSTFDLLGVPRQAKNTYHDLTANARLTLFLAQTHGIKVEQPEEEE